MANVGINIPDGGAGASSAVLLADIVALLTGSKRDPEIIVATIDGVTPDNVQSLSVLFQGSGGTFDGKPVPNGWIGEWGPNKGDDTVASKPFTVPTIGATKQVIITYVDL